jgi:hypothetical protein
MSEKPYDLINLGLFKLKIKHRHKWAVIDAFGAWIYEECATCSLRRATRLTNAILGPKDTRWLAGGDWSPSPPPTPETPRFSASPPPTPGPSPKTPPTNTRATITVNDRVYHITQEEADRIIGTLKKPTFDFGKPLEDLMAGFDTQMDELGDSLERMTERLEEAARQHTKDPITYAKVRKHTTSPSRNVVWDQSLSETWNYTQTTEQEVQTARKTTCPSPKSTKGATRDGESGNPK